MAVHPGERSRIASTLGRFRLTTLGMFGLALVAAFLTVTFWMNAPQPPPNHVLMPGVESGGLGLTRAEWDKRYGPGQNSTSRASMYTVGPGLSNPSTVFPQP